MLWLQFPIRKQESIYFKQWNYCKNSGSRIFFGTGGNHDNNKKFGNEVKHNTDNGDIQLEATVHISTQKDYKTLQSTVLARHFLSLTKSCSNLCPSFSLACRHVHGHRCLCFPMWLEVTVAYFAFRVNGTQCINNIFREHYFTIVNRGDWLGSPANIKGTNKDAEIYVERSTTLHKLLFSPHTLCMNYVTNTFLLVSSSVWSKQLLCFVQGQGQKTEQ